MHPHRALIIVDVHWAFSPPPLFFQRLYKYSRGFECRIFTRFINPAGSLFRRALKQDSCAQGSPDTSLIIQPSPGDLVIEKNTYGLTPPDLRELHRRKIKEVVVSGLDTDACVLGVMFSLFDAGIVCYLKENMCWSSSGLHKAAVAIIRKQFPEPR